MAKIDYKIEPNFPRQGDYGQYYIDDLESGRMTPYSEDDLYTLSKIVDENVTEINSWPGYVRGYGNIEIQNLTIKSNVSSDQAAFFDDWRFYLIDGAKTPEINQLVSLSGNSVVYIDGADSVFQSIFDDGVVGTINDYRIARMWDYGTCSYPDFLESCGAVHACCRNIGPYNCGMYSWGEWNVGGSEIVDVNLASGTTNWGSSTFERNNAATPAFTIQNFPHATNTPENVFNNMFDPNYFTNDSSQEDYGFDYEGYFYIVVWMKGYECDPGWNDRSRPESSNIYIIPKKHIFDAWWSGETKCLSWGSGTCTGNFLEGNIKSFTNPGLGKEGGNHSLGTPAWKSADLAIKIIPPDNNNLPDNSEADEQYATYVSNKNGDNLGATHPYLDPETNFYSPDNIIDWISLTDTPEPPSILNYRPVSNVYIGPNEDDGSYLQKYYSSFFNLDEYTTTSAPNKVNLYFDLEDPDNTFEEPLALYDFSTSNVDDNGLKYKFFVARWDFDEVNETDGDIITELKEFEGGNTNADLQEQNAINQYIVEDIRDDSGNVNTLSHVYTTPGIKIIKAFIFSYSDNNAGLIHAFRWKLVTIKINLNEADIFIDDFSEIGGPGFKTIPWPNPGKTPIISGVSVNSSYYNDLNDITNSGNFLESEGIDKNKVNIGLNNAGPDGELGDFVGKIDLEQLRVFKGARNMANLLMIDNVEFYPVVNLYDNFQHWGNEEIYPLATGIAQEGEPESCVGLIFINDSSNPQLKNDCILEFNFGNSDKNQIFDTSGQGNTGILLGDYSINKDSKEIELIRDTSIDLPETDNEDRAI